MKVPFFMESFNSADKLVSEQQHCFKRELPSAVVEEVLQAWPKHLDDHDMVLALLAVPHKFWKSLLASYLL